MTLLNFEFSNTEICCSSFPPPHQLVYSSPVSASFRPSHVFHTHGLSLLVSSLYILSSVFVDIHPTHTPFASSPGSADHLPPSMCSMSVRTFVLHHLCSLYSHPLFFSSSLGSGLSSSLISVHCTHTLLCLLQKVCALVLLDICLSYSPPPLLSLSPDGTVKPLLTHTPQWTAQAMGYEELWANRGMVKNRF